ncbi:hypothetical protein ACK2RV_000527 [Yersinia enterocolitica]
MIKIAWQTFSNKVYHLNMNACQLMAFSMRGNSDDQDNYSSTS